MTGRLRLAVVTPAVNRQGGTEKCMSWLVEDLSDRCDLTVITAALADTDVGRCRVVRVPTIMRPRTVRFLSFLAVNRIVLALDRLRYGPYDAVLATSGDCLSSDIIYAHFCCAAWSARLNNEVHDSPRMSRARLQRVHRRIFMKIASRVEAHIYRNRRIRAVIAVSSGTRDEIALQYHVRAEKLTVIPNAVDPRVRVSAEVADEFRRAVRQEQSLDPSQVVLVFTAAGDWGRKGLGLVLEALAQVDHPAVRLLVLGDDDIPMYRRRAHDLAIEDRVRFVGLVPDVERYLLASDVFVFPSAYEAFSLVTLEAAGAGLPMVVTNVNGVAELVVDGVNGLVVDPDSTALAAALHRLIVNPDLRARMAAAARVSSNAFDRERVASRVLATCARRSEGESLPELDVPA